MSKFLRSDKQWAALFERLYGVPPTWFQLDQFKRNYRRPPSFEKEKRLWRNRDGCMPFNNRRKRLEIAENG